MRAPATFKAMSSSLPLIAGLGCLGLVVVAIVVWFVATYNRLIRQRNQVRASWAQTDVQLKRRYDLIPNLVETVKGYAAHERGTLEAVVAARAGAVAASREAGAGRAEAENLLTQALGRLFAVVEAYPDLKANRNFAGLQTELAATEDKIAYARQFYNSSVQALQNTTQAFPSRIVAGLAGITAPDYFQADAAAQGLVQVRF